MELAHNIVAGFHGEDSARKAGEAFDQIYSKRQLPSEMTPRDLSRKAMIQDYAAHDDRMKLSRIVDRWELAKSKAEAERLMAQGAVEWDGNKITRWPSLAGRSILVSREITSYRVPVRSPPL